MTRYKYLGSCHCGNVSLKIEVTSKLNTYSPRACDCSFCTKHGAAYVSDKDGKLTIYVRNKNDLSKYQHGSQTADFLICKICGVLVGVCYEHQGHLYATVNSKAIDNNEFKPETIVSPQMLNKDEKIQRWQDVWFADVSLK